ncbi:unnamed protein product [Haemonchus placei]|uniref:Uncharacterized protein n=1 Tax=Haemonchus placei TaxID=6290 RepID=A0A0N4WZ33_HAEPC|nr:unnamed protein product [Haemonchus placei]
MDYDVFCCSVGVTGRNGRFIRALISFFRPFFIF